MPADDMQPPLPQPDWILLTRYVAGECSPGEAAGLEHRLADEPALRVELEEARRIWNRAGALPSAARLDAMWRELRAGMPDKAAPDAGVQRASAPPQRGPARPLNLEVGRSGPRWRVITGVAAAGIAAVAAGVALRGESDEAARPEPVEREFRTARGERATVALADGSEVGLGAASHVRVRLHDNGRREVWLEGEAVFNVVHDERRPFVVYSGNAVTEDLGTTFGIRAYPGDEAVRVIVVSGEVALRQAGPRAPGDTASVVLGPRDVGEVDLHGRTSVRRDVDPQPYLAWTQGRLVFRQATLAEVAAHLERWYDVDIVIDGGAAARRITLDLRAASLEEVLRAVTVPLGLRYERVKQRITLIP